MIDSAKRAARRCFWKGFITCAAISVLLIGIAYYNNFRSQLKRTDPTEDELSKIAAILDTDAREQRFKVTRYEFSYVGLWMDKFGSSGAKITRVSNSASWQNMLKHWQKMNELPPDFNRLKMHDWVRERLDPAAPFYVRWVNISFSKIDSRSGEVEADIVPQLCAAFFDKDDPDVLYLSTEGELMFPQCTLVPGETTGTLDWTRNAWDGY